MTRIVKLREIAFARSGDKGDIANIGVVPYEPRHYGIVREQVTVARMRELFGGLAHGDITRFELPGISALNFVMNDALSGGVSLSLGLDLHGKAYGSLVLDLDIEVPDDLALPGPGS